ncbi:ATP-binding protein [Streptomyces sp. AN091965]|uniref:ATP-binding protein n=1 Tax=Streptomyces sp. AN091965 TaxID=2927803 RepID=UPI001F606DAE|nr:ATP-binding protein [Streptomyces sp. AN091965]MCI3928399.1 ATP-binding protein [Streptomyces sp. AN091965]
MSRHERGLDGHGTDNGSWSAPRLFLSGFPADVPDRELVKFRVRLFAMLGEIVDHYRPGPFVLSAGYGTLPPRPGHAPAPWPAQEEEPQPPSFSTVEPLYTFDQLVLPEETVSRLLDCVSLVEVAPLVFDTWNLRSIEPHPSTAVNFRGPPGTGKTMAAHAVAHRLGRRILSCRLSDLESKYHGEGPKNLAALFATAKEQNAVLFVDEAESLLSRRFAQPQQAAESAINSMRTELLMALDTFQGLVIFASNLPHSYDAAVESRLLHVDFALPDHAARRRIWQTHLPAELPVHDDVSPEDLADVGDVSGRDIKLAVVLAAVGTARRREAAVTRETLLAALKEQRAEPPSSPVPDESGAELSDEGKESVAAQLRRRLADAKGDSGADAPA